MSLPSRPRVVELALVAGLVIATAGWMAAGVRDAALERSEHQEEVRRLQAGEGDAVPESRRFEAREQIVDANLRLVRDLLDGAPTAPEPVELALAVESLVESRAASETEVLEVLGRLRDLLETRELEQGYLDVDLAVSLELVRDVPAGDEEE